MSKREARGELLESRDRARVVPGRVIRPDFFKPLVYCFSGILIAILGLLMLGLVGFKVPALAGRLIAIIIFGLLQIVAGVLIFLALVARNRRLIIGADRLQLATWFGRVLGQLPYNNIVENRMGVDGATEIVLLSMKRRDTWWTGWSDRPDCAVSIRPNFESDATLLRLSLRDALRKYRDRHGDAAWQHGRQG